MNNSRFINNPNKCSCLIDVSDSITPCSKALIMRLINAYTKSYDNHYLKDYITRSDEHIWNPDGWVSKEKADIHNIVYAHDEPITDEKIKSVQELLSSPLNSELWYGFHEPTKSRLTVDAAASTKNTIQLSWWDYDVLYAFGQSIGATNCTNPEVDYPAIYPEPNKIIMDIESVTGKKINFPSPYPYMRGVSTDYGIVNTRAIWGLYLGLIINDMNAKKVLEIGAGLGWAAYYSKEYGVQQYTIIDIPMTALACSHFLGLTLGEDRILLYGEDMPKSNDFIQILPPKAFPVNESFDIVVNIDSFTEIGREIAKAYVESISKVSHLFYSINHEYNEYTVAEIMREFPNAKRRFRKPFWLRRGYVEELYEFE